MPYKDKDKQREHARRTQAKRHIERSKFIAGLKDKPCMDCGGRFPPECMDFDHREGKIRNVSLLRSHSIETILAEVAKCDIICSNCHRIRTKIKSQGINTRTGSRLSG